MGNDYQATYLKLILHDPKAWESYFDKVLTDGIERPTFLEALKPAIESMPERLKGELLRRIRLSYARLKKYPAVSGWGAKRAADMFIGVALQGDAFVLSRVRSGEAPLAAYTEYLKQVQRTLMPNGRSGYQFTPDEILRAAIGLRKEMLSYQKVKLNRFRDPKILLFGSFPNGMAVREARDGHSSDVDALFSHLDFVAHLPALQAAMHDGNDLNLSYDGETKYLRTFGLVHPLMIEITTDGVNLLVFQRTSLLNDKNGPRMALPKRFVLWREAGL